MIFLTHQVSSSQSSKLPFILKKFVKISSDDHIQINVKLFAFDFRVEQCNFSPPFLPSLLKRLDFDVLIKARRVFSEAVKGDIPSCISFDACIKFIHIICRVPWSPLYTKHTYFFLFFVLLIIWLPRFHLNGFKTFITRINLFLCILNNLIPSITDGLIFFTQLSHHISKVNDCLILIRFEFKRNLTQVKSFLELVDLDVHDSKICVCIYICVERV